MGSLRATFLLAALVPLLGACGDVELEGPHQEWPNPSCPEHLVLDPWDGTCRKPACQWDEDCPEDLRCDLIEGKCVSNPVDEPFIPWSP